MTNSFETAWLLIGLQWRKQTKFECTILNQLDGIMKRHLDARSLSPHRFRLCRAFLLCACQLLFATQFSLAAELGPAPTFTGQEPLQSSRPVRKQSAVKAITVNTLNRNEVVNLYKTVYAASGGVSIGWNGDVLNCVAGANDQAYQDATLLRINYFRAMAGLPGDIIFDEAKNAKCQEMALMISANGMLSHEPGSDWHCYTTDGAEAAGQSNIALGWEGPSVIDAYIDDWDATSGGRPNAAVGHRRWILYPPSKSMGNGSIPFNPSRDSAGTGGRKAANALWIFGDIGSRPAEPAWVAWPPQGYIPYQVLPKLSGRWSFSYGDADFSNASVSMQRNGTNIALFLEQQDQHFGDNTIVWLPSVLVSRPSSDRTYTVTVSNVVVSGVTRLFSYDVTIIDPDPPPPAYTFSTLAGLARIGNADGPVSTARFFEPFGVAVDSNGNLYVTDCGNRTLRKITRGGVVSTFAGLAGNIDSVDTYTGSAARFYRERTGVAVDVFGNVYVADIYNHTIRKIGPDGTASKLAGLEGVYNCGSEDGTTDTARFNEPTGVAVDSSRNVYVADTKNHTIRKITPGGMISTLAGLAGSSGSVDGAGSAARFDNPTGVAVDRAGNVYVVDLFNPTIRKITPGGIVTTLAGLAGSRDSVDGLGAAARFENPFSVAVDTKDNVYVADTYTVRKITPIGEVTTVAGLARSTGSADGARGNARFERAWGVTVDSAGILYIADFGNDTIRKITPDGTVSTLAGLAGSNGSADGTGSSARFYNPTGLAVNSSGILYVADTRNNTIRKITAEGAVSTLAGLAWSSSGGSADGTGTSARFSFPMGVAVDRADNVFVADMDNHTIRKITPDGMVSTFAGLAGSIGSQDGIGSAARFWSPIAVTVDFTGNVYVADNSTIREITPTGVVKTLVGVAGSAGGTDGTAGKARLFGPMAVAIDGMKNMYVADGGKVIRQITPTGFVTTLAGSSLPLDEYADGSGGAARFGFLTGVAVDHAGYVYLADTDKNTIRMVTPDGFVSTIAGLADEGGSTDGTGSAARFFQPSRAGRLYAGGNIAADSLGNIYVADTYNNTIRKGVAAQGSSAPIVTSPSITVQPQSQTVSLGANVGFSVGAVGPSPLSFQWRKEGVNLAGATNFTYSLTNIQSSHAGSYSVIVSNSNGNVLSSSAKLTVDRAPQNDRFATRIVIAGMATTVTGSNAEAGKQVGEPNHGINSTGKSVWWSWTAPTDAKVTLDTIGSSFDAVVAVYVGISINSLTSVASDSRSVGIYTNRLTFTSIAGIRYQIVVDGYGGASGDIVLNLRASPPSGLLEITTVAGHAGSGGSRDGTGETSRFLYPFGITVDGVGNIYVADGGNHSIRMVTPAGMVSTLAGSSGIPGNADGKGSSARFGEVSGFEGVPAGPTGVAVDGAGNVYVADAGNRTVRKITPDRMVTTLAGLAGSIGSADGLGSAARFGYPWGVAVDSMGNVYVTDQGNHTIRKITPSGMVSTLAGLAGSPGLTDGTGSQARFFRPFGIAVDGAGNVYVAGGMTIEADDIPTIRKITPGGVVTTLAGSGFIGSVDGPGSVARFNRPWGVAVDSVGNLYVADSRNNTIRKVTPGGLVSTLAGLTGSSGNVDGTGGVERFNQPTGVAVDNAGNIYVADFANHTIRKGVFVTDNVSTGIKLSVQTKGNEIMLSWSDPAATLEEADDVIGPWRTSMGGSISPRSMPISANRKFYRLRK